jgi:hypothetical protein
MIEITVAKGHPQYGCSEPTMTWFRAGAHRQCFGVSSAINSISTIAPPGRALTPTADRDGGVSCLTRSPQARLA